MKKFFIIIMVMFLSINVMAFGQDEQKPDPNVQVMQSMEAYYALLKPFLGMHVLIQPFPQYGVFTTDFYDDEYTEEEIMNGTLKPIARECKTMGMSIPLYFWIVDEKGNETLVWENPWIEFMNFIQQEARQIIEEKEKLKKNRKPL